jgi:hypothetical protein
MGDAAPCARISRRDMLALLAAGFALARRPVRAQADSFADVVGRCDCSVTGHSLAADAEWWMLSGKRRIVTLHRFAVEHVLAGEVAPGDELLVRTLGGVIGDYGQRVVGEAEIRVGAPALLLLTAAEPGLHAVSGMEHGYFRLERDASGVQRLRASHSMHAGPCPTAQLEGASVSEAQAMLARSWRGLHAP